MNMVLHYGLDKLFIYHTMATATFGEQMLSVIQPNIPKGSGKQTFGIDFKVSHLVDYFNVKHYTQGQMVNFLTEYIFVINYE